MKLGLTLPRYLQQVVYYQRLRFSTLYGRQHRPNNHLTKYDCHSGVSLESCISVLHRTHIYRSSSGVVVPELTSIRRSDVKRGSYASVTPDDISHFCAMLDDPASQVITGDEDQLDAYNTDWLRTCRGSSRVVLRPKTSAEVSDILCYCNKRNLAVTPQGGNTGLVGGGTPVFDEIVLSTQLMNKIIDIDPVSGVLWCQSGCVLEQLDNQLSTSGFVMPLDLGAKGSCHIGGNVSTNAGGIRLLRYGSLHGSVLGVEAVLASGEVVDTMTAVRKDNVGYHLKHMFIGSEGTLGVITAVSILCPRRPASVNVAFLGCQSFADVLRVMTHARENLNEILSAYEFIDSDAMQCVLAHLSVGGLTNPVRESPFYILIETSGSNAAHDEEKLNSFLDAVMSTGLVTDGTVATDPSKIKKLWQIRESIAAGLLEDGYCYKYDISLPLSHYYEIVNVMRERLSGKTVRVCGYGHVVDGNLHLNATSRHYDPEVVKLIQPFLFEYVQRCRGSISAEHGLGLMKNNYMRYGRTLEVISLMKNIKRMMDPNMILNPYKTLPLK